MLHHEIEKYTFFSQIVDNRKVFNITSGVSQFAFMYLERTEKALIIKNKSKQTEINLPKSSSINVKYNPPPNTSAT